MVESVQEVRQMQKHNITILLITFFILVLLIIHTQERPQEIINEITNTEQKLTVNINIDTINSVSLVECKVPDIDSKKKTYMDYRTITDRSSKQYEYQQGATTSTEGLRMYDGCYMVALGTFYADYIGQRFIIVLESGEVIKAIVGDFKANQHTDDTNRYIEHNNNIVEFIIDTKIISEKVLTSGDVGCIIGVGRVTGIYKILEQKQ